MYTKSEPLSGTGVSSEHANNSLEIHPTNKPEGLFAQQANTAPAMDAAIMLPFDENRVATVGGVPPTIRQTTVPFDEAFVMPVIRSVSPDEVTVAGAEELPYGGGQNVGHFVEVIFGTSRYGAGT